jgi:hypothetical protein
VHHKIQEILKDHRDISCAAIVTVSVTGEVGMLLSSHSSEHLLTLVGGLQAATRTLLEDAIAEASEDSENEGSDVTH